MFVYLLYVACRHLGFLFVVVVYYCLLLIFGFNFVTVGAIHEFPERFNFDNVFVCIIGADDSVRP